MNPAATRARVERYQRERIAPKVYAESIEADVRAWSTAEPVPFAEAVGMTFAPTAPGELWGAPWGTTWFRIEFTRPADWAAGRAELVVDLGFTDAQVGFQAEGLAYDSSGVVIKAVNPRSRWVPVDDLLSATGSATVYVEAAANPCVLVSEGGEILFRPTPLGNPATAGDAPHYRLGTVSLTRRDDEVRRLASELEVLAGIERELPPDSPRRFELLRILDRALDRLDSGDIPGSASAAREILAGAFASPAAASAHRISAVGHAHIDSAWLWPFRETRRKVARTIANVLQLMEEDPELIYAMSSAQQYAWLKEDHPALFERVRARVAEGRFVPVGGMWVESDTNMPSGEALVRQFIEGGRFFDTEFGIAGPSIVWLPDSFGYSAALPQLFRLAGAARFLTQKISWNEVNTFPHHTFWWEGIDGSRVFTHFPPADTYNAELVPAELAHAQRNFADKGAAGRSLVPFGYGDGGGGPTREMMDRARLQADIEGSPRVAVESPEVFFDLAEAEFPDPSTWMGELYLEFHRGVLTSQARTKRGSRRVEALFRAAELWSAQARIRAGEPYPAERISGLWRRLILLHFHDVLPGSSIAWVHDEAEAILCELEEELNGIIDAALAALARSAEHPSGASRPDGRSAIANSSPVVREGVGPHSIGVPSAGRRPELVRLEDGAVSLQNEHLRVVVSADGTVASLVELASGREVVPAGERLNLLQLHPDTPNRWDAWDIDESYRGVSRDLDSIIEVDGATLAVGEDADSVSVSVVRTFGASTVRQTTRLTAGSRSVRFETVVDWHESEALLKVALPVALSTERWAAETQFGHVFRPTTANTSWEAAKFEACAHRWVHVEEPGFGVAVANASTYGHEVRRARSAADEPMTQIRLSLLRAPRFPDPDSDTGEHTLVYAVAPGATIGDAVGEGYLLGDPGRELDRDVSVAALVSSSDPSVIIDTVKCAEDGTGDLVFRAYESRGAHASTVFRYSFDVAEVWESDFSERRVRRTATEDAVGFHPFQLRTFRVGPQASATSPQQEGS
jgi:alpha-mannosidase